MKHLLVIARDPVVHTAFETALSDVPCAVLIASETDTAIRFLLSTDVDLIFLDLQGFAADGLELLQRLRSRGNPVPVFVVSHPSDHGLLPLQEAASRGVHYEIMRKPLDAGDIRAATTAVLAVSPR